LPPAPAGCSSPDGAAVRQLVEGDVVLTTCRSLAGQGLTFGPRAPRRCSAVRTARRRADSRTMLAARDAGANAKVIEAVEESPSPGEFEGPKPRRTRRKAGRDVGSDVDTAPDEAIS